MKRLIIPAFATIVIAAAAIMLLSPSAPIDLSAGAAAMPTLQDLHATAGATSLPVQDIED